MVGHHRVYTCFLEIPLCGLEHLLGFTTTDLGEVANFATGSTFSSEKNAFIGCVVASTAITSVLFSRSPIL